MRRESEAPMAMDVNSVIERRRLRRRLSFWRVSAIVLAALAVLTAGYRLSGIGPSKAAAHVARININGMILGSDKRQKMLEEIGKSRAQAVLVEIDSPGGGVTASEELFGDLRMLAAKKPVVAVLGSVAASGGYIAALGADRIFARETSLTGSIGVLAQYPDLSGLLASLGVKMEEVKSAPLKAEPSMFHPTTPEGRAALESLIMDSFAWFKGVVATRRGLEGGRIDQVADGRAFTGRQALELGLIDELGGEAEARDWLARDKGVSKDLPVRDWEPSGGTLRELGFAHVAATVAADLLGMPALADALRRAGRSALDLGSLDGLVAIWHPSLHK
jgi:protease IV